ncbi:MAG: HDOD domain-containing protein [Pseudomonadota bacterium]
MSEPISSPKGKLSDVFAKINMSELPAMSVHVQELLALTSEKRSANYDDLAKIILKDFSLTHKVLQFANSAYYALGQKVSTVSMAVAVLGFDSVRDIAIGIALFDDFVQAGVNTDEISELLARSFMGALLARSIAESRYLKVLPEEAFICGLMRNLGKIISCIYLPEVYNAIKQQVREGRAEGDATRDSLDGLDYAGVGREVAIFWNMTESVIHCMQEDPAVPEEDQDSDQYLHCIVDFSNRYVEALWGRQNIDSLMEKYGFALSIDEHEAVKMLSAAAEASAAIFDSIRPGIGSLDFQKRLKEMQFAGVAQPPPAKSKGIDDYWREISGVVSGNFQLKDCFLLLVDALFLGMGLDRVILAMLKVSDGKKVLLGQLGRGDISSEQIRQFQLPLSLLESKMLPSSLALGADMDMAGEVIAGLPGKMQMLLRGRGGYVFSLCLQRKIVALLYVDKQGRAKFGKAEIEWIRKFRDLAVRAIELTRIKGRI